MNQILHAAARGARVQGYSMVEEYWYTLLWIPLTPKHPAYRIHPDDEHLRFGHLSTSLREIAKDTSEFDLSPFMGYPDELTRSIFLLLLSESLADEGL